jgi:hypothetical protein
VVVESGEAVTAAGGRVPPDEVFVVWPPPPGAEVDPFDFGVSTGADGPRGPRLNTYVPRDVDGEVEPALREGGAVVLLAPRGAGATRTVYEAVGRVLPRVAVCIAREPRAFRLPAAVPIRNPDGALLWLDDLGAHWRESASALAEFLPPWLERAARYFIAVCYEDDAAVLADKRFEQVGIPVLRVRSELSAVELRRQEELLGSVLTRSSIGFNPPIPDRLTAGGAAGTPAAPRVNPPPDLVVFSQLLVHIRRDLGDAAPVTAGELAFYIAEQRPQYAAGLLGTATIPLDVGERLPLATWLAEIRGCYDLQEMVDHRRLEIDGRLALAALSIVDTPLREALGAELLQALAKECDVRPRPPKPREQVRWLADEPVGIAADELGRVGVADALYKQLTELILDYPGRSFLVHVDGAWGAGKSTLLGFLAERSAGGWRVVPYDAWRQSRVGPPWLTVLHALRASVRSGLPTRRARAWFWLRERARLVNPRHWVALGAFLALGAGATAWLLSGAGLTMSRSDDLMKLIGGVLSAAATLWLAVLSLGRFVSLDSRRSARAFLETRTDPMEDLVEHFDWVLRQAERPVLLLVDDLDRCTESFVVELLDAVQKLMRDDATRRHKGAAADRPSLIVVVAADGRWIRSSYDNAHASLAGAVSTPGATVGSLFLEKLFQLTVPVPRLSEELKTEYLTGLLADRVATAAATAATSERAIRMVAEAPAERLLDVMAGMEPIERVHASGMAIQRMVVEPEARRRTQHALEPYAGMLDPTPRAMKRFVMAYSMLRAVRIAEGSVVGVGPLALWTILQTRWPMLAEFLQADPPAVRLFAVPADQLPESMPAALRPLFANPPAALRAVMNHPDGPLDERAIRDCSGQSTSR